MTPVLAPIARLLAQPLTVAAVAVQALRPSPLPPPTRAELLAPVPSLARVVEAAPAGVAGFAATAAGAHAPASRPLEAVPAAGRALFDGAAAAPSLDAAAPAAARAFDPRPTRRLNLLSAEDLGGGGEQEPPRPRPEPEAKPFLYRHHALARFFAVPVLNAFYAVEVKGLENLPKGGALILPNHASFLDPVLAAFALGRPARFLMYRPYYETYGLQWLFRSLGVIPISHKDPKEKIEESLNRARRALAAGETVVIFPEGNVTPDGNFQVFRRGFERVAAGLDAPVVPMHISGMWGSLTSRHPGRSWASSLLARLKGRRAVAVRLGPPLENPDADAAREAVVRLASRP